MLPSVLYVYTVQCTHSNILVGCVRASKRHNYIENHCVCYCMCWFVLNISTVYVIGFGHDNKIYRICMHLFDVDGACESFEKKSKIFYSPYINLNTNTKNKYNCIHKFDLKLDLNRWEEFVSIYVTKKKTKTEIFNRRTEFCSKSPYKVPVTLKFYP